MLNIEKYEKELREYGIRFALTKEGKPVSCSNFGCDNCAFEGSCTLGRMNWLLEEYKEPILTEEGKEFLKQLIAPFISNKFVSVCINKNLQTLRIDYEIGWTSYSKKVLGEKWDLFKNLDFEFYYTSKELDLC